MSSKCRGDPCGRPAGGTPCPQGWGQPGPYYTRRSPPSYNRVLSIPFKSVPDGSNWASNPLATLFACLVHPIATPRTQGAFCFSKRLVPSDRVLHTTANRAAHTTGCDSL